MALPHAATRERVRVTRGAVALLLVIAATAGSEAQRVGYPADEFAVRRQRLAKALGQGTVLMFGATEATPGVRFRQDNDFYYLTGNHDLHAAVLIDAPSGVSHLFLPTQDAADVRYHGANWLGEPDAARRHGFASIRPLSALHETLARRRGVSGPNVLWMRLSERDDVDGGRYDAALATGRRLANPFAQHPNEDAARVAALRAQYPYLEVRDLTPQLDELRLIKSAREIETLRRNGRISAEAIERAIRATAPGRYEYELEAEATYWLLRNGAQGGAYPAIVGSGPMGNRWHYQDNGRQLQAGELVVMDYGGSLDHLTMDITRTWPVSGRFTDRQLQAYRTVLSAQQAIIAAIRPGVTREAVSRLAQQIFRDAGFDPAYAYLGHYVGMSVHDVGDWNLPFREGMVLAIEPILDLPKEALHVRVEDTVVVTAAGAEVLTAAVPKAVEGLLEIVGTMPR